MRIILDYLNHLLVIRIMKKTYHLSPEPSVTSPNC